MFRKFVFIFTIGLITFWIPHSFSENGETKVSKKMALNNDDFITSYSYKEDENVWTVNASMKTKMTASDFVRLLETSPVNCHWLHLCQTVQLLDSPEENTRIIITRFSSPWPLNDRVMITESSISYSNGGQDVTVTVRGMEDNSVYSEMIHSKEFGLDDNYVIVIKPAGEWRLNKQGKSYELTYSGSAQKEKGIPSFFLKRHIRKSTIATFRNLKRLEN